MEEPEGRKKKRGGRKVVRADSPCFFGAQYVHYAYFRAISLSLNFVVSFLYRSVHLKTADADKSLFLMKYYLM